MTGRVQGVGFRELCRREASRLGVAGWVRNRTDGSVEAVLEGPQPAVDSLIAWCRIGPPSARVLHVEREAHDPEGTTGFEVR